MLRLFKRKDSDYHCGNCGLSFPKKTAKISGEFGFELGAHIHCPKCGVVVAHHV